MYKFLFVVLALLVVVAIVAVIAFTAPTSPPAMASMAAPLRQISFENFPAPRQFQARDGASLQYYADPAEPDKVAVLVHGSAGPGTSMHAPYAIINSLMMTRALPTRNGADP